MDIINKVLFELHLKKAPPQNGKFNKELPQPVKDVLLKEGLNTDSVILSVKSDMNNDELFSDCYVFFDEKGLYFAEMSEEVLPEKKSRKKLSFSPRLLNLVCTPMGDIDEMLVERNLSTGRLTYKKDGEYYSVCFFSLGLISHFEELSKVFNAFKKGEDYKALIRKPDGGVCKKCGAPVPPGKSYCPKCEKQSATVKRLFTFFDDAKGKMIFIIAAILVKTAMSLILPQFSTQKLYDDILNPASPESYDVLLNSLISLVLTVVGLKLINSLFTLIYQYVLAGVLPKVIYSVKLKIFTAMQHLSLGFYTQKQTGSLMERVTRDSNNIYWFFVDGFPYVITSGVTVAGILVIMFMTSAKLTLMLLAASLIIVVAYPIFERIFRKLHHEVWVHNARLTSKVSDSINGHRIIKAFSKEEDELSEFEKLSTDLKTAEIKVSNTESTVFPLLSIIVYFLGALVLGYGGVLAVKYNELTVGELLKFVVYLGMLQSPIEFLSWVTNWWARCIDSVRRVFEITDSKPDIEERENAVDIKDLNGDIEISKLTFSYEPARPVIKNLSLKIDAGKMLGIVGKTGAGKTTISNLIARLYDPDEGSVKIDGVDVKDLKFSVLRKNIGIVSQDIFLFMGTIADNIRYAKPDATDDEVIAAAKAASAHGFITALPDGYETRVGSGGQDLSGGERQRISIARTIIQNPKILILDEATAAMDTETERNIQNSLSALKSGRTTIAIAHRLSTLRDADELAVIKDGECVEFGTYDELLNKKGEYYKMFKLQEEALKFIGIGDETAENEEEKKNDERTR